MYRCVIRKNSVALPLKVLYMAVHRLGSCRISLLNRGEREGFQIGPFRTRSNFGAKQSEEVL
jgi:hypothetical protein